MASLDASRDENDGDPSVDEPEDDLPEEEPTAQDVRAWLRGAPLSERWHLALGFVLPALLLVANMLRVRSFTIDDAYISYRYARNFARGLGLVYNAGERIEGYTNFLWTVVLGAGIRLGLDPDVVAKALGGLAACGSLWVVYQLSRRVRPFGSLPCFATWLFASSIVQSGYAVFGLETSLFVFLILAGTELMLRERDRLDGAPFWSIGAFPYSSLLFGLACLTRPEAPLFFGVPMLFLGLGFFRPQNLLRGAVCAAFIGGLMLWRHGYYGTWLPNTMSAKTGDLAQQLDGGRRYLWEYAQHSGPTLVLSLLGLCIAIVTRRRDALCFGALSLLVLAYVLVVGGDWMPCYRFLSTYEPYGFVLACIAVRELFDTFLASTMSKALAQRARGVVSAAVGGSVLWVTGFAAFGALRGANLASAQRRIDDEKLFWDSAAGGAAEWLRDHGKPGEIAVGDIGYIGYLTDFPLLDLLGLVDPVISKLPGGYTHKTGPGYVEHVFEKKPRYFVFVGSKDTCNKLPFPAQEKIRRDRRFQGVYEVGGMIRHSKGGYWCVFERRDDGSPAAVVPDLRPRLDVMPDLKVPSR